MRSDAESPSHAFVKKSREKNHAVTLAPLLRHDFFPCFFTLCCANANATADADSHANTNAIADASGIADATTAMIYSMLC